MYMAHPVVRNREILTAELTVPHDPTEQQVLRFECEDNAAAIQASVRLTNACAILNIGATVENVTPVTRSTPLTYLVRITDVHLE